MLCPRCGADVGSTPQFCGDCRAAILLQAGGRSGLRSVALPVIVALLVLAGLCAYLLRESRLSKQVASGSAPAASGATAPVLAHDARLEASPSSLNASLLLPSERLMFSSARASQIEESRSLQLLLFAKNAFGGERLEAELQLLLPEDSKQRCDTVASIELHRFIKGRRVPILSGMQNRLPHYSCSIEKTADDILELSLSLNSNPPEGTIAIEFRGPLRRGVAVHQMQYVSEGLFQFALWDHRTGRIEVGLFAGPPSVADIEEYKQRQALLRGGRLSPLIGIALDSRQEVNQINRQLLKSFQLFLPIEESVRGLFEAPFTGLAVASSTDELRIENGTLGTGQLLNMRLRDTRLRAEDDAQLLATWDLIVSAPILDIRTAVPAQLLARSGPVSSDPPVETGGIVQTPTSTFRARDAVVLYYPEWNTMTVALYSKLLDRQQRQKIVTAKSVWNAGKTLGPNVVFSFVLSSERTVQQLEVTLVRGFFGEFHFAGARDRLVQRYMDEEIHPLNLLSFALPDGPKDLLRFRFRDQRMLGSNEHGFFWDVAVAAPLHTVQ